MRDELEIKLVEKYPEIFRDYHGDIQQSAMPWGFSHGDGWYHIIDDLCATITAQLRYAKARKREIENVLAEEDKSEWNDWKKGYYTQERLDEINKEVEEELNTIPIAMQVKEKFGTLRFYVHRATDEHYALISMAERMSTHTCEVCGDTNAQTWHMGWNQTLCMEHAVEKYGNEDVLQYLEDRLKGDDEE
jgi:hypothetical protein